MSGPRRRPRACADRNERLKREDATNLAYCKRYGVDALPYTRVAFTARSGRELVRTATDEKQVARLMRRRGARLV